MTENKVPVISFIKGANIRPKVDGDYVSANETTIGRLSYYCKQGVFSTLTVEDLPSADFSPDDKIRGIGSLCGRVTGQGEPDRDQSKRA